MVISNTTIISVLVFAFFLFLIGVALKGKKSFNVTQLLSTQEIFKRLDNSNAVAKLSGKFNNETEIEKLFNKAKNPWNISVPTYNFIRFIVAGAFVLAGLLLIPAIQYFSVLLFMVGTLCFFMPKSVYKKAARQRENQWNQLYQIVWVIKHNLSNYGVKRTLNETQAYIASHYPYLTELETAFGEFSDHWNQNNIDEYLSATYGELPVARQLLDIFLNIEQTGEPANQELDSLRKLIIEKMNFHAREVLASISSKATLISTPFLMVSVLIIVLVPVLLKILESI